VLTRNTYTFVRVVLAATIVTKPLLHANGLNREVYFLLGMTFELEQNRQDIIAGFCYALFSPPNSSIRRGRKFASSADIIEKSTSKLCSLITRFNIRDFDPELNQESVDV